MPRKLKTKKQHTNADARLDARLNNVLKYFVAVAIFFSAFFIFSEIAYSDPPTPQNVLGRITNIGGSGVQNGIPVRVNNTNISQMFYTQVFAPPIPSLMGSYSLTINGSLGDYINVFSYNATNYGQSMGIITNGSTRINVTLNLSRPSEANVSIKYPLNNTIFNASTYFNLSVNFSVLGSNGANCNLTLTITNESLVSRPSFTNRTNYLGNVLLGEVKISYFELLANETGVVNISVEGLCSPNGIKIQELYVSSIMNISVKNDALPIINIISPLNNTENKSNNNISFVFLINNGPIVNNCSIYINGTFVETKNPVQKNVNLNFSSNLSNGNYYWKIDCNDYNGNLSTSGIYFVNVSVFRPRIFGLQVTQDISLIAGGTKIVECNFSLEDGNGQSDIVSVNATLFRSSEFMDLPQNNNSNYKNLSCLNLGSSETESNYSCTFSLQYYAINGTWNCTAKSSDLSGFVAQNTSNTSVDPLFALNVSQVLVQYGDLAAGAYSDDVEMNITNFGNQNINISIRTFGGNDPVLGDGLAMLCTGGETIAATNHRFAIEYGAPYLLKYPLSSINQDMGFTINKQSSSISQSINSTYLQLYVPPMQVASCNGTIVYTVAAS